MVLYNKAFPIRKLKISQYLNFIEGIQQHDGWFDNAKTTTKMTKTKQRLI
jgi:hypothetical protein